jgi:hypothetical protein
MMMNPTQLLESLGAVEPADPEVLDRTAATLRAAAASELQKKAPIGTAAVATTTTTDLESAAKRDASIAAAPGKRQSGPRSHRWLVRAAAVVVVVGATAGTSVLLRPGSPAGPGSAAAAVLRQLAAVASAQPAPSLPGPGQYLYVASVEAYVSTVVSSASYSALVPENRQIWQAADGSGRLVETYGQPAFLSPQDRASWEAAGSKPIDAPTDTTFGPGGLGGPNVTDLPTNPVALGAEITSRKIEGGPPGPAEDFTQIGDLLRETDAPPALRSALYQVAAGLPGVQVLHGVTDHSGRTGTGVAYVQDGLKHELIFDPATSALLGEVDTVVGPGSSYHVAAGTVVGWAVYLQSSVVGSTTAVPSPATGTTASS